MQALEVDGVRVASFRNAQDAARVARTVTRVLASHPGQGLLKLIGVRLYEYGQTAQLTAVQRARFNRVVAISEGP